MLSTMSVYVRLSDEMLTSIETLIGGGVAKNRSDFTRMALSEFISQYTGEVTLHKIGPKVDFNRSKLTDHERRLNNVEARLNEMEKNIDS